MFRPPLLLGHRGARASASTAENTVASFGLALEHGCDGFEFDVRLAGCGCAVICHDAEVRGIAVSEVSDTKSFNLPMLQEVLAPFANRAFLDIELKVPGLSSEVLLGLRQYPPERGYVVSSFLPEVLLDLKLRNDAIPLGIICDDQRQVQRWRELPVQYVMPQYSLITPDLVQEIHEAGKMLFAWTVNERRQMLRLAEWRVDGIISDETELLVKTLRTSA
jgi:glycerophosphoryl diester phosphodiesterase